MNRREFLLGCAATLLIPACSSSGRASVFLSPHKKTLDGKKQYFISAFDEKSEALFTLPMPADIHSLEVNPLNSNQVMVIARDPGVSLIEIDLGSGKQVAEYSMADNRHLNGHGVFSAGGDYFYASENNFKDQQGVIGIYDLASQKRVGEYLSGGQGPHEMKLLPGGKILAIANGGVQTHPSSGRKALNIAQMDSSLTYLDVSTGKLLSQHRLPHKTLSIRHMTADKNTVVLILQNKIQKDIHPVVAVHDATNKQSDIEFLPVPDDVLWNMTQYTASAVVDPASGILAVTCPRGNRLVLWNLIDKSFLKAYEIFDVGGVAFDVASKNFMLTGGDGDLYQIDANSLELEKLSSDGWSKAHWGNHLAVS